jgi:hypothetical protein
MTVFLNSDANMALVVGRNWPAASLLARSALLRSRLPLFAWCGAPDNPVDITQEIQDWNLEIPEFPPAFLRAAWDATRNTYQLCALGSRLLPVQLRHPSPLLQLVGQVQLCVYYFLFGTYARIPNAAVMIDVLSAALDASYSIGTVVIFFTLQYPDNGGIGLNSIQTWWGNTVYTKTADYQGVSFKTLAEGETFGPKSW